MTIHSYRDLDVWKKGMLLARQIQFLTAGFPREEIYGLTSQIRRAAVSIPANIAEGNGRNTGRDYANFISIAMGSARELDTLLLLSVDFGYVSREDITECLKLLDDVNMMLYRIREKLRAGMQLQDGWR